MKQKREFNLLLLKLRKMSLKLVRLKAEDRNISRQSLLSKRIKSLREKLAQMRNEIDSKHVRKLAFGVAMLAAFEGTSQISFGAAQTNPFGLTSNGGSGYSTAGVADLDGDGDLDLMSGAFYYSTNQGMYYYENTGSSTVPTFAAPVVDAFGAYSSPGYFSVYTDAAFADLDNDGDMDLMITDYYGNFFYQQNDGALPLPATPVFAAYQYNPFGLAGGTSSRKLTFIDIDDDGDFDIFTGDIGNLDFIENVGSITAPSFAGAVSSPFGFSAGAYGSEFSPSFTDIDADGDFDLFLGTNGEGILYCENTGDETAPAFGPIQQNPFSINVAGVDSRMGFDFTDLNGDGLEDIIFGNLAGDFIYLENTTVFAQPEIDISGNSTVIASGDVTPSTADSTDIGNICSAGSAVFEFTIDNTGGADLNLTGGPSFVTLSGSGAAQFSVTTQPASGTIASMASETFQITYTPSGITSDTATVTVGSDDADEGTYTFSIRGTGIGVTDQVVTPDTNTVCGSGSTTVSLNSQTGVNYYLRDNTDDSVVDGPVAGTGGAINLTSPVVSSTSTFNVYGALASDSANCNLEMTDLGVVEVLTIPTSTDTRTECDSLVWIDGNTYFADNNTATHTFVAGAANGCDSIVTLDLTILPSSVGTDTRTECDSLVWIDGNTYFASNNTAMHTIVGGAANGCDSTVTLDLTILPSSVGTDTRTECDSLVWIDGNTYFASNNTAMHTIIGGAANGCDSTVTLDLTIIPSASSVDTRTECDSLVWLDGITYFTSNNTATFTYPGGAANGCDSTVTLDLTINNSVVTTDTRTECDSLVWIDGLTYFTDNNSASNLFAGGAANGCDSTVNLDLTILNSTSFAQSFDICGNDSVVVGTDVFNATGVYTSILVNAVGCDSVVTTTVNATDPIMVNPVTTDVFCFGDSSGTAQLNASGGAGNLVVDWMGVDTTEMSGGFYTYSITDDSSCVLIDSVFIVEREEIMINPSLTDIETCFNDSTGMASLNLSGGTGALIANWYGADPNALWGGSHLLTVTDALGCSKDTTIVIAAPDSILSSAVITDVSCFGLSDGMVTTMNSGGSGTLIEDWSGNTPTALAAGNYTYTVTDDSACIAQFEVTIAQPDSIVLTAIVLHETLGADGEIDLSVSGGTPNYQYDWSNLEITEDIAGLTAGTYTITVTDDNGCVAVDSFAVENATVIDELGETICNVFPNPTNGVVTVDIANQSSVYTMTLMSLTGEIVIAPEVLSFGFNQVSLDGMSMGVYLLQLVDDNGKSYTTRVIKM